MLIIILNMYIFSIKFDYIFGFYKDYTTFKTKITGEGKVTVEFGFERASFMTRHRDSCDMGYAYPHYMCDAEIYQTAAVSGNIDSRGRFLMIMNDLEDDVPHPWYVPSNIVHKYKYLRVDLSTTTYQYFHNSNYPEGYVPKYFDSDWYYNVLIFCAFAHDIDILYSPTELIRFCKYRVFSELGVKGFVDKANSISASYMVCSLTPRCRQFYFKETCWKKCKKVPHKFECSFEGDEVCIEYYEPIFYEFEFYFTYDNYDHQVLKNVFVGKCIFFNDCAIEMENVLVRCNETNYLCFPLSNHSHTCLIYSPLYHLSGYSLVLNSSFSIILVGEYLMAETYLFGHQSDNVYNRSVWYWTIPPAISYYGFDIISDRTVLQVGYKVKYGYYHFILKARIGEFRNYEFHRYLYAYELPTIMEIVNLTFGKKAIFIGQLIKCTTNAVPLNASFTSLLLTSKNFDKYNISNFRSLFIPLNAEIGFCSLECIFTFVFSDGRPSANVSTYFVFEIQSFVFFQWKKKYKNVYSFNETAGCHHLAYFTGFISIKVIIGKDRINPNPPGEFTTYSEYGGAFLLLCKLQATYSKTNIYYKTNSFEVFNMPTDICIQLFFPGPGAVIKCGHDGYPPDQASFHLGLYHNENEIIYNSWNYIKIPYAIAKKSLTIVCQIKFFIYMHYASYLVKEERNYEIMKKFVVSPDTSMEMKYSTQDYVCMRNDDQQIDNSYYTIDSQLHFEGDSYTMVSNEPQILFMNIVIYFIFLISVILFVLIIRLEVFEDKARIIHLAVIRRLLNDKLYEIATLSIEGRLGEVSIFRKQLFKSISLISKDQTEITSYS